jgi:uncharacterized membrane protein YedE/YeeE
MVNAVAFFAGLLFAIGLALAGMTQPSKILAFLDFTGAWDPSLAFVMMGAIATHLYFARRAITAKAPLLAPKFVMPEKQTLDGALLVGSAIFGIGWGMGGYCPGPALTSIASLAPNTLAFAAAMTAGVVAYEVTLGRSKS